MQAGTQNAVPWTTDPPLPGYRVSQPCPFAVPGVDYLGPIYDKKGTHIEERTLHYTHVHPPEKFTWKCSITCPAHSSIFYAPFEFDSIC